MKVEAKGGAAPAQPKPKSTTPAPTLRTADNGLGRPGNRQLQPGCLDQAEFARSSWLAEVEQGTVLEDVLRPAFWAHHATRFTPRAHVEVWAKDGSWYAELVVLDCSRTWARMHVINGPVMLTDGDVSESQAQNQEAETETERRVAAIAHEHTVEFNPSERWRVIRKEGEVVVAKLKSSRDDAEKWLRAYALHTLGKGPNPDIDGV